jgi:hypothetical protein
MGDDAPGARVTRHMRTCDACRTELMRLRQSAAALRARAVAGPRPLTRCLSDDEISVLAENGRTEDGHHPDAAALDHLAACARCCQRLAAVTRLLKDERVAAELLRLEAAAGTSAHGRFGLATTVAAATLAAAVLAMVFVLPRIASTPAYRTAAPVTDHRESAITTTVAPRIVGPFGIAAASDSLRWTSVPHADRYAVRMFDREGTLVWNPETSDTVLAIPPHNIHNGVTTYLWKVEARTSWDRWVASEWADLTIGAKNRR